MDLFTVHPRLIPRGGALTRPRTPPRSPSLDFSRARSRVVGVIRRAAANGSRRRAAREDVDGVSRRRRVTGAVRDVRERTDAGRGDRRRHVDRDRGSRGVDFRSTPRWSGTARRARSRRFGRTLFGVDAFFFFFFRTRRDVDEDPVLMTSNRHDSRHIEIRTC